MKVLFILIPVCSFLLDQGVSDAGSVSVKEGGSVTLHTGVETTQRVRIKWYFNDTRIAQINGDPSKTCTDVQCNEGAERFRDRLKLDHQTGSLTITNTRNTDSGDYKLMISSIISEKIFSVSVTGVSAAEQDGIERKSVKEGESVALHPDIKKNPNDSKMWYFNYTLIAEMTGDQSKICTDVQCKEKFRDRLKLDHQTGSLNITDTRTTDSGLYQLKINSGSSRRRRSTDNVKSFVVTVSAVQDSGAFPAAAAGAAGAVVVLLVAAAGVIYYRRRSSRKGDVEENNQEPLKKTYSEKEEDKDQMT